MAEIVISNATSNKRRTLKLSELGTTRLTRALEILKRDQDMEIIHDHILDALWDYRNKVDYWRLRLLAGFRTQALSYEVKSNLNRLAFNILNLSKLFLDKHYHKVNDQCFAFNQTGSAEDKEAVRIMLETIKSNNLRYFVGYKLRNRSQHGHMPVSQFTTGLKSRQVDGQRFVSLKIIFDHEKLKQLGIAESRIQPDTKLDLTEILDGYVYAVSQMHVHNRTLTEKARSNSKDYLRETISTALEPENGYDCFVDLKYGAKKSEYIGLDCFELASHLRKKHPYAIDYSKLAFGLEGL